MTKTKIIFYIGALSRGGAERVFLSLITSFLDSQQYDVSLVTDYKLENEYDLDSRCSRTVLCKKIDRFKLFQHIIKTVKLHKILKKEKADVCLSFLGKTNIRNVLSCMFTETKSIVSVRNDPHTEYSGSFTKWLARALFKKSLIVFQTNDATNFLLKKQQYSYMVIPNPVSSAFENLKSYDFSNSRDFIMVCRLVKQKNIEYVLERFETISQNCNNAKLDIYGDGPLKESLIKKAEELNISHLVNFKSNVLNIENQFPKYRVFLLTSLFEGMPNTMIEAVCAGVPYVVSDCPCGGARDIHQRINGGYLFDISKDDFINKTISIYNDENTYLQLQNNMELNKSSFYLKNNIQHWFNAVIDYTKNK